jgi:hypothetical protein
MFNPEFLLGLLVLGLTFAGALALSAMTGIGPTWTLISVAVLVFAIFALWERRLSRWGAKPEVEPIHVDWKDKLSETDFPADSEQVIEELQSRGLTPQTALGQSFVFATEHEDSDGDIWFEGHFVRDGDRIVIRATEPV